jgi:hypothetical protein
MRGLLLGTGTMLFILLCGCSNLEPLGSRTEAIHVVTGRCPTSALQLRDGLNHTGSLLCLEGLGTYVFPVPPFTTLSFKTGEYEVTFHESFAPPMHCTYAQWKSVPLTTNSSVHNAIAVTRTLAPVDAGSPVPGVCHYY